MIRSSANGNSRQTARGIAELTFEKSVCSKSGSPSLEPLDARLGAVEEVEEVALGRRRVVVWELAPVDPGETHSALERRDEAREPRLVGGIRVLAREDEDLAARELGAEIARAPVPELRRRDLVHARSVGARGLDAAVARAGVDHDDLHLVAHDLPADRVEAADEVGAAVLDRDDDGDHAGSAATTNWYAKSGGRSRPTACATRSVDAVRATGSGTVKSRVATR